jgi:tetratricopeptide (TPR) repeat protein
MNTVKDESFLGPIEAFRQSLFDIQNERHGLWERVAQEKISLLKSRSEALNEQLVELLVVLEKIVESQDLIAPDIAIEYVTVLVGFAGNVNIGSAFVRYIDRIIDLHKRTGRPLAELYLARNRCLGLINAEGKENEEALNLAREHAASDDELLRVLQATAWYQIETSQYEQSIQTSRNCLLLIEQKPNLSSHKAGFLVTIGMAYFLQFNREDSWIAFQQASVEAENVKDEASWATSLHYLGRIMLDRGDLLGAMRLYVDAQAHQEKVPYEPVATAFYHLRLAELLLAARLLPQARDHLGKAQELFALVRDDAIGQIQVELAAAEMYRIEGKYPEAFDRIHFAVQMARSKGFYRGELLCLVKLFWLQFGRYDVIGAIHTLVRAMLTWREGELGKNNGLSLLRKYLKQVLLIPVRKLRRKPYTVIGAGSFSQPISSCICPMHREM